MTTTDGGKDAGRAQVEGVAVRGDLHSDPIWAHLAASGAPAVLLGDGAEFVLDQRRKAAVAKIERSGVSSPEGDGFKSTPS